MYNATSILRPVIGRFLAKFNPWKNTVLYWLVRLHCLRIHPSVKLSTPKLYIDVPRPLINDLWIFLSQMIDAECVK